MYDVLALFSFDRHHRQPRRPRAPATSLAKGPFGWQKTQIIENKMVEAAESKQSMALKLRNLLIFQ
jgi:hypothetical protein